MTNQNKYEDWEKGLIKAWGGVLYLGYHILPVNLNNLVDFDRFKNIMVEYFKNSDSDEDMQDWMSDVPPTLDKGKYSLFDKNRIDKVFTEIANKTLTADELIIYRTSDNHMSGWNSYTLRNDNSYTYKNSLTIAYKLPKGFPVIFADGIADNDEVIVKSVEKYIQKQQINEVKRMQQLAGLTTESSAFNDAGEPMMTHNQFRDYSEPSENDEDDGYDNDEIDISREFINEMKKNNIFVETFNGEEYFIRCKQLNIGEYEDFTIYFPNDETILIYDTRNNEQEQEFGYQGAVDYVLENKGHLLTFDESVKQRDSEMDIDSQDRKNNRAEMGGYGLG